MSDGRIRVAVDCDPGIDDAVALFLAFASPELDVVGVSTVAGNVGVDQAADNAARLCDLVGVPAAVPLTRGRAGPIARARRFGAEAVHGPGGLGGLRLPASNRVRHPEPAVSWLARAIRDRPGSLIVIALGPLTNVACLLHENPDVAEAVREIVVMGGAGFVPGNVTPAAEFNFYADPEAARYVTESGVPLRIIPLDVTRAALTPVDQIRALAADAHPVSAAAGRMLGHLAERYEARHGVRACAVHDAVAVAAVVRPDLFSFVRCHVAVECAGELTRGALIAEPGGRAGNPCNAWLATGVDSGALGRFLLDRLAGYSMAAPTMDGR